MKTVFIINPAAGHGKKVNNIIATLENAKKEYGENIDYYVTKSVGDAKNYTSNYCETYGPARFIACGGDGTFGEVLNGMINCKDAQIGVIPIGTGNDFCRNFAISDEFMDISKQIAGTPVKCDAIKYSNEKMQGYCANMFNIGFDCHVVDMTGLVKKKTFLRGPLSYFAAIFVTLIKKKGANLKIETDGEEKNNGKLLLTSLANGNFCGGGIKSNPFASVTDGLIDINIIFNVSRIKFLFLLLFYIKGTHMKLPGIHKIICNKKCKKITITPLDGNMRVSIDGEVVPMEKTIFEVVPGAFDFVLPCKK